MENARFALFQNLYGQSTVIAKEPMNSQRMSEIEDGATPTTSEFVNALVFTVISVVCFFGLVGIVLYALIKVFSL